MEFPDYSAEELLAIAKLTIEKQNYHLSESAVVAFKRYIERRMQQPHFANGRSVRNALDRARLRQANRHFAAMDGNVTREQLMTIEDVDILASRVFLEPVADVPGGD